MNLINCPQCGKRISSQNDFCPECGCDLTAFSSHQEAKTEKNRKGKFIVLFVSIAILCATLFVCFPRMHSENVPESDSDTSSQEIILPTGVYSGDDSDILVIAENGTASYYCTDTSYTELACPWSFCDNVLSIDLAKLHCTISANLSGSDFSTLILDSDNINWNAELFHRLDLSPDDYLSRKVFSCDPAIQIQNDGSMDFVLDDLCFLIPKHYIDLKDSFDQETNHFFFADINAQEDYEGALMISLMGASDTSTEKLASAYSGFFLDQVQITEADTLLIADREAEMFNVSGIYNSNILSSGGAPADGRLTVINGKQPDTVVFVLWVQIKDRPTNNSDEYASIISSIR